MKPRNLRTVGDKRGQGLVKAEEWSLTVVYAISITVFSWEKAVEKERRKCHLGQFQCFA